LAAALAVAVTGVLGGCGLLEQGTHETLSGSDFRPVRELVAIVAPDAHIAFERDECAADMDGGTSQSATSRTSLPGDAAEVGRRLQEAAVARGFVPLTVAEPVTAYLESRYAGILVERAPGGTVVRTSVIDEQCVDDGPPALLDNTPAPMVTPAQQAAFAPALEASTNLLTAVNEQLPVWSRFDGGATARAPGGVRQSVWPCRQDTPQVGLTSWFSTIRGRPSPQPTEGRDPVITTILTPLAERHGWTSDYGGYSWTKELPGQTLKLSTRIERDFVSIDINTTLCAPYL
ncbi:MAG: hypothetical protein HOV68_26860, partial [Streptomycetaceae bacterium]|nr:hypothetical protein [Streptomycetaceae bacterium]